MPSVWWPCKNVIGLDLEVTTPQNTGRIVQVGLAGDGWSESIVIDPETEMGKQPDTIPGVTQEELEYKQPFEAHVERLHRLLTGAVVVGHNVSVDLRHLSNAFERAGYEPPRFERTICTWQLCRRSGMPGPHSLKNACDMINIDRDGQWHNARSDAVAAWRLYAALMNRHPELRRYYYRRECYCRSTHFIEDPWVRDARLSPIE